MHRFFIGDSGIEGRTVALGRGEATHMRALRIRGGETFTVCDGAGRDYICRLTQLGSDGARAEILEERASSSEPSVRVIVYLALSKGERLEYAVQKCVELGAAEFFVFPSARTVASPGDRALANRLARLSAISKGAAEQSGRGTIPAVSPLASFGEAIASASKAQLPLFFYEGESAPNLRGILEASPAHGTVSVITGPEGGFEPGEAESAERAGCLPAGLGPRILRCDTAPVAALACIMLRYGALDR
ncbi:MAG: 16S rRNA (uracil(1498)-N(3))-methyltransferase [Oscillospiraceae bacterium]|jgi:16S rRNA (uracil1498-N3)-methyltransferase|nr:16S rRNA (uracil(1498)-N(3))-methyltransferase [Oscillospiraceae bacterium]